jgi:peptidoglycan hydrolase CwlO-like protein
MPTEEYERIQYQIQRMLERKERCLGVIHDLEALVDEVNTDIQALKLQLDALRHGGEGN